MVILQRGMHVELVQSNNKQVIVFPVS